MLTTTCGTDEILRFANPSGARKSRFAQDANGSGICLQNRVLHALVSRQFPIACVSGGCGRPVFFLRGRARGVRRRGMYHPAPAGDLLERGVKKSAEHSMLKGLMKIPDLPQLFLDVALLDFFWES